MNILSSEVISMTVLWFFSEIIYDNINLCLAFVSSKQSHFIYFWYSATRTWITRESRHLRSPTISQNDPIEFTLAILKESHSFTFILHIYANIQILLQVEALFLEHRNILSLLEPALLKIICEFDLKQGPILALDSTGIGRVLDTSGIILTW
jgi:hypothetical protein